MSLPLLVGLHGYMGKHPAKGVHDAAFCLADTETGQILSLIESEKLSAIRHDGQLNLDLLQAELAPHSSRPTELISSHFVAFADEPKREFPLFRDIHALDWSTLSYTHQDMRTLLNRAYPHYVYLHELAHVFSAFMYRTCEHQRFLGLVIEGSGSFTQNSLFLIDGYRIELLGYNYPILSGNFFHQWLSSLVFDAQPHEHHVRSATPGKAMALAAYGNPAHFRPQLEAALDRFEPGDYINFRSAYCPELMNARLSWTDRVDLCAAGQVIFEERIVDLANAIRQQYGDLPVYYAGGCALSIKTNALLRQVFSDLIIPPNCADDGIALGLTALHAFHNYHTRLAPLNHQSGLIAQTCDTFTIEGRLSDESIQRVAQWLANNEVVAFIQGAVEIGPRALCRRSILANPSSPGMRDILNHIKNREYYRPVSPIVLDSIGPHCAQDYFFSPFMLYDFKVIPEIASSIPSALHADDTLRLQTIPDDNADIARLLRAFAQLTGKPPILLNTSLNSRGQPIAATKPHVLEELARLKITHMVLGDEAIVLT